MKTIAFLFGLCLSLHAWSQAGPATDAGPTTPTTVRAFFDCPDVCPAMVALPGGAFTMGSPPSEPGRGSAEGPQRRVTVRPFAIGRDDVTRGQWAAFVADTDRPVKRGCAWAGDLGPRLDPERSWRDIAVPQADDHPVVCVTWQDARDFAQWLRARTGRPYRLPTEAEWEYAARGGSTTAFPQGDVLTHDDANHGRATCCGPLAQGRDRWMMTSPVGSFPPNRFGLFDMNGNVLQWVQDCLSTSYANLPPDGTAYEVDEVLAPDPFLLRGMAGRGACEYRMLRGGDWGDPPEMLRSAFRNYGPPRGATLDDYRSAGVGFRVARSLD